MKIEPRFKRGAKNHEKIRRLNNARNDIVVELEAEMAKIWPLGSTVKYFHMKNQKIPSVGKVLTHDGIETKVLVKGAFFRPIWIKIQNIVEE